MSEKQSEGLARIAVSMPQRSRKWIKLEAAKRDMPMSVLTSKIIQEYIDAQESKTAGKSDEGS